MSTANITFQGDSVKATIPKELYMAIVKVQGKENLDWDRGCLRAAELIDSGSEAFSKKVDEEARRLKNSVLMKEINKARASIEKNAVERGAKYVRDHEDNFRTPCSKCQKLMYFRNSDSDWGKERVILYGAFSTWCHTTCQS
jgi:hypothetical protein